MMGSKKKDTINTRDTKNWGEDFVIVYIMFWLKSTMGEISTLLCFLIFAL